MPKWRDIGARVPGAAAAFAPWAAFAGALYYAACTFPALGFDEGHRWSGSDALFSALFPVFWIADPRSIPAAASNLALYAACVVGLAGRPRAAYRLALAGGGCGLTALALLRFGWPVLFDEGGSNRGQFTTLLPGGELWLLAFAAAAVGALAARWGAAGGRGRRLAVGGAGLALAAATIAWKAHTEQALPSRVAAAIRADDGGALESAFRDGAAPKDDYDLRRLTILEALGRSRAVRAAAVALRWRVIVTPMLCDTAAGRRARAALGEAAVETDTPVFIQLQLYCGDSGTRNRYPAAWAAVLDGALARRRVNIVVALVEAGLDLRCPLAPGGPSIDTLLQRRFDVAALARIRAAAHGPGAADVTDGLRGCGFKDGVDSTPAGPGAGTIRAGQRPVALHGLLTDTGKLKLPGEARPLR